MSFRIELYIAQDQCWQQIDGLPSLDIGPTIDLARKLAAPGQIVRVIDWQTGQVHAGFPWKIDKYRGVPIPPVAVPGTPAMTIWGATLPDTGFVWFRGATEPECIFNAREWDRHHGDTWPDGLRVEPYWIGAQSFAALRDGKSVAFGRDVGECLENAATSPVTP